MEIISKYKFDNNLLKLSSSKDLSEAKKEWYEVSREERDENTGVCICQRKIKNIIYMCNKTTGHIIHVGTACYDKLGFVKLKSTDTNEIFKDIVERYIPTKMNSGEYIQIDDIIKYANEIKKQLLDNIHSMYEERKDDYKLLLKLELDVKEMVEFYKLEYLRDIFVKINEQIKILLEQQEKQRKEEQERIRTAREDKEREGRERELREHIKKEEQELIEKKRIEEAKERALKIICKCGIKMKEMCECRMKIKEICKCNSTNYDLEKICREYYCTKCKTWKLI
jgi:hypothetical protein